jgi:hypothetical protein
MNNYSQSAKAVEFSNSDIIAAMSELIDKYQYEVLVELLTKHGYIFAGTCNCGGYFTEKYRNGKYLIKWRKKRYLFKVIEDNCTLRNWQPIKNLEQTLNELAKKDIEA